MAEIDPITRRSIDLFLDRVRRRHRVVEAWLFGSRARGTSHDESDVDLALVIDEEIASTSSLAAEMGGDTYDVMDETGRYVVPLPIALSKWREPSTHSNPYLLAAIRREGLPI